MSTPRSPSKEHPTGSVATVRQLLLIAHALGAHGLSLASVCAEAGLASGFFAQGLDAAVAPDQERALHELCERHVGEGDFIFRAARIAPLGAYSLVELPLVSASTLTEVEEVLERAWREPGSPVVAVRSATELTVRVHDALATRARWLLKLGTWVRLFERLGLPLERVGLPFPPEDSGDFDSLAGEIAFNRAYLEFTVPANCLPCSGNPFLFRAQLAWLEDRTPRSIEDRIRAEVRAALQAGDQVGVGLTAERMGLSVRTLQRRLGAVGVPYRRLVMDVRCTWATALLQDPSLQIAEIASMVGFNASSSFDRSFRGWSGSTPTEWRVRHRRALGTHRVREVRDEAVSTLALAVVQASTQSLLKWSDARVESDPALAALGLGWLAARAGAVLEAQRQFTDALRQLASQHRAVASGHALRALGEFYLDVEESWSADTYLELAVSLGSGLMPVEVARARQLRCLVRVRANRVSQALRALRDLEVPEDATMAAVFRVRSAAVLVEAGQFEGGVALLPPVEDLATVRATHRDLLRIGGVLVRHGRPRLLRRVMRLVRPIEQELQPSARAICGFLVAAGTTNPEQRLQALHAVSHGLLGPFIRVEALQEGLVCAREMDVDVGVWQARHEAAATLAENVRTSLRAGEVRSFNTTEYAREQLR